MSTSIPIYDNKGLVVDHIKIDEDVQYVNGRVSKGKKYYYKGIGVQYEAHSVTEEELSDEYNIIKKDKVFYLGYYVSKKCFEGKFGIFQEKHQPQFSDFIGTCGVKELSILENSYHFDRSSVEIIKSYNFDKENGQYYFKLNYLCNRRRYLEEESNPKYLRELLDYMIQNDWNFIWDKKSINDISYNGLVSDVGDLFHSKDLQSKVGTVYSLLYSLGNVNHDRYLEFLKFNNLEHKNLSSYIFNGIEILKQNNVDISPLIIYDTEYQNYQHIVLNYLVRGRNCGHCCYVDYGERIKNHYIKMAAASFNIKI